jgi:hypothetical protein
MFRLEAKIFKYMPGSMFLEMVRAKYKAVIFEECIFTAGLYWLARHTGKVLVSGALPFYFGLSRNRIYS